MASTQPLGPTPRRGLSRTSFSVSPHRSVRPLSVCWESSVAVSTRPRVVGSASTPSARIAQPIAIAILWRLSARQHSHDRGENDRAGERAARARGGESDGRADRARSVERAALADRYGRERAEREHRPRSLVAGVAEERARARDVADQRPQARRPRARPRSPIASAAIDRQSRSQAVDPAPVPDRTAGRRWPARRSRRAVPPCPRSAAAGRGSAGAESRPSARPRARSARRAPTAR